MSSFTTTSHSLERFKVVKIPEPAGIDAPENEKPRTVEPPAETVNPASPAAPPEALLTFAPSILN